MSISLARCGDAEPQPVQQFGSAGDQRGPRRQARRMASGGRGARHSRSPHQRPPDRWPRRARRLRSADRRSSGRCCRSSIRAPRLVGRMAFGDAGDRRHDLAGRAVAALERVVIDEGLLHRMQRAVGRGIPSTVVTAGRRTGPPASGRRSSAGLRPAPCRCRRRPRCIPSWCRSGRRRSRSQSSNVSRGATTSSIDVPLIRTAIATGCADSGRLRAGTVIAPGPRVHLRPPAPRADRSNGPARRRADARSWCRTSGSVPCVAPSGSATAALHLVPLPPDPARATATEPRCLATAHRAARGATTRAVDRGRSTVERHRTTDGIAARRPRPCVPVGDGGASVDWRHRSEQRQPPPA